MAASANPLVTVICSTYNSKATLRCALRTVLNQDFADFEVRVMGDACTDGTEQVIAELNDPRLHWFNFPKNNGSQSEPNNEGLRRARGQFIAFIGHDDLWFPWHLTRLVDYINRSGADLVHDLVANIGMQGVESGYGPPHPEAGYARTYVPTSSWLHRRELPGQVGFWKNPNTLSWSIDYDFSRRVAEAGRKISFLPSLGVLKFHSIVWKAYARQGEPPQQGYLDSILKTPSELSERILAELTAEYVRRMPDNAKKPFGLAWRDARCVVGEAFKAFVREFIYRYGDGRWPVGPLLRYRMRRLRSKHRVMRGLASLKESGL